MSVISRQDVTRYAAIVDEWLKSNSSTGKSRKDVLTGADAWEIAFRSGIVRDAIKNPKVYDAHIQTALETIFPNAVFRDAKRY